MTTFWLGVITTLAILFAGLVILTRGKIFIVIWFLFLYGIARLMGRNPLG